MSGPTPPTHTRGAASDGGVSWNYIGEAGVLDYGAQINTMIASISKSGPTPSPQRLIASGFHEIYTGIALTSVRGSLPGVNYTGPRLDFRFDACRLLCHAMAAGLDCTDSSDLQLSGQLEIIGHADPNDCPVLGHLKSRSEHVTPTAPRGAARNRNTLVLICRGYFTDFCYGDDGAEVEEWGIGFEYRQENPKGLGCGCFTATNWLEWVSNDPGVIPGNGTPTPTTATNFKSYGGRSDCRVDVPRVLVTNATAATPIVITTDGPHGLQTWDPAVADVVRSTVQLYAVGGIAAAKGRFRITKLSDTTFSLQDYESGADIAGTGAYTSGGYFLAYYSDISAITNATPPVVTTTRAHGLATGDRLRIAGVVGTTNVNGVRRVTVLSATTFSVQTLGGVDIVGNGVYVSGGWTDCLKASWRFDGTTDISQWDHFATSYPAPHVVVDSTVAIASGIFLHDCHLHGNTDPLDAASSQIRTPDFSIVAQSTDNGIQGLRIEGKSIAGAKGELLLYCHPGQAINFSHCAFRTEQVQGFACAPYALIQQSDFDYRGKVDPTIILPTSGSFTACTMRASRLERVLGLQPVSWTGSVVLLDPPGGGITTEKTRTVYGPDAGPTLLDRADYTTALSANESRYSVRRSGARAAGNIYRPVFSTADSAATIVSRHLQDAYRPIFDDGASLSDTDVGTVWTLPDGKWGSTATISAVKAGSKDSVWRISITAGGTGIAANPTVLFTPKDGPWLTSPFAFIQRCDNATTTGAGRWIPGEAADSITFTYLGTPSSGGVYVAQVLIIGTA
jgi:hypothetical protein